MDGGKRTICPTGSTYCSLSSVHLTISGGKTKRYCPGESLGRLIRPRIDPSDEIATSDSSTLQEMTLHLVPKNAWAASMLGGCSKASLMAISVVVTPGPRPLNERYSNSSPTNSASSEW